MNLFIFISFAFLLTLVIGSLLEKIKIPWIFAALLLGVALSINNPFITITQSESFTFLGQLGLYMLLFIIGLEINLKDFKKSTQLIIRSTFFIILFEALLGALAIKFLFGFNWLISILAALSFATVGEAILVPILDEFKLFQTKIGKLIVGIGTLDDIFEIIVLIFVTIIIGSEDKNLTLIIGGLISLFALTIVLYNLKERSKRLVFAGVEEMFIIAIIVLFLFLGIGQLAEAGPLAAILAGLSLKTFVPNKRLQHIEHEIKSFTYGFFAPIFFIWVGSEVDISSLFQSPVLLLTIILVSLTAKLLASYITTKKELGSKQSLVLGLGLSVRFSTSIVIVKILFDNNLINSSLFSVIIASSIIFNLIIPLLFSRILNQTLLEKKSS